MSKTNWDEKAKKDAVQSGKGPGEFGPDYSDRKAFHLDYHANWEHPTHDTMGNPLMKRSPYPARLPEEKKMACDNIECHCEGCTCDPCICTPDNLCGCAEDHSNDWKGLV